MFTDEMEIFKCIPPNHLLSERDSNEAYCIAEEGKQYALYFPDGGEVIIDLSAVEGGLELRWMNISYSSWLEPEVVIIIFK